MRDNFSEKVKKDLAGRAGYKCSNPDCRISTIEAKYVNEGTINIGEAAHICAASEGGMRYNPNMSSKERSSAENGIWLCSNCATMIDRDDKYTVAMLYKWKYDTERKAQSTNGFSISKFDRSVIDKITDVFETSNMIYILKEHDFQGDFQREYVEPLFELMISLEKPSMKVQNTKLNLLLNDMIDKILAFKKIFSLKGGPSKYGNGSYIIDFKEEQQRCNDICDEIWEKYEDLIEYTKLF